MLKLTSFALNLTSGMIVCRIICTVLSQSATIDVSIPEADLIAFNDGVVPWTETTIAAYLATQNVTVSVA